MVTNQYINPCILVPHPTSFLHDSYIISAHFSIKRRILIISQYENRFLGWIIRLCIWQ